MNHDDHMADHSGMNHDSKDESSAHEGHIDMEEDHSMHDHGSHNEKPGSEHAHHGHDGMMMPMYFIL